MGVYLIKPDPNEDFYVEYMDDFDKRCQAISDFVPQWIRAKVAYKEWQKVEEWRLGNPFESNIPSDPTKFWFEGKCWNPQIDFNPRKD